VFFYFNSFLFGVFRNYKYYFRVPPGVRVPQVGNHCSRVPHRVVRWKPNRRFRVEEQATQDSIMKRHCLLTLGFTQAEGWIDKHGFHHSPLSIRHEAISLNSWNFKYEIKVEFVPDMLATIRFRAFCLLVCCQKT
jgi:hypothetical protein